MGKSCTTCEIRNEAIAIQRSTWPSRNGVLLERSGSDLPGLTLRNAQRRPSSAGEMLRHVDDLPHVIGEMRHQSIQGFHHEKRLATNVDRAREIAGREGFDRPDRGRESRLPPSQDLFARRGRWQFELPVAIAV